IRSQCRFPPRASAYKAKKQHKAPDSPWTRTTIPAIIRPCRGVYRRGDIWGGVMSSDTNRRKFLGSAAGAAAFTILPRHVLARSGEVPPSDKINLAYIGTGTQGLRELLPMLASPEIQVVSVCDPCKNPSGYRDWSRDGLLKDIRRG